MVYDAGPGESQGQFLFKEEFTMAMDRDKIEEIVASEIDEVLAGHEYREAEKNMIVMYSIWDGIADDIMDAAEAIIKRRVGKDPELVASFLRMLDAQLSAGDKAYKLRDMVNMMKHRQQSTGKVIRLPPAGYSG